MPARPILAVIPARLGSERLPRKPLHPLAGRPLVEWVWRRVRACEVADRVVVATDSEEIAAACRAFGAEVAMTAATHRSGTERAAEVAAEAEREDAGSVAVVLNVQGDEPFVTRDQLRAAVEQVESGADVGTVAAPIGSRSEWVDPAVVKVVRAADGTALYFSRAPIPFPRDGGPTDFDSGYLRHVGVYAYTPEALRRWVALPPEPLEEIEKLEQLRPLAAGLRIGVGVVAAAEGGVDTAEDAARAEKRLNEMLRSASLNAT